MRVKLAFLGAGVERGGCYSEAAWFGDARHVDVEPLSWEELRGRQTRKIVGLEGIKAQGIKYCSSSIAQ